MSLSEEIENRFQFHAGTEKTIPLHTEVRTTLRQVAHWVNENIPDSREKSLALTDLQSAMMWCNAALAIHTPKDSA